MVTAPPDRPFHKRAQQPNGSQAGQRLPPSRAFVVQLPDGDLGDKPSRGRVEHVQSGRSTRFEGLDRLVEFFAEVLRAEEAERDEEDDH
jgi:hypothetical protein